MMTIQVNKVKAYRVAKGVSQLELARRVGVSRQTINMIENDKYNPTLNLCIRIAQTLDVTLNDLFWEGD
ncbi:helix-turn-helix transcriptional regulator [Staphylococcus rostri]|nr:helix-turn-helix transcriptional regulator [Staphylococcus rostri]